jgi:hypothetical protein
MSVVTSDPVISVQSRVSWGALLAGAAVGIATYTVLGLLGIAVGLSVADTTSAENLGLGAGVWAFVSLVVAMFFAGWVTTQCTVGETRTEAVLYGVVVWALTATFLVWSAATGIGLSKAAFAHGNGADRSTATAADLIGAPTAQSPSDRTTDNSDPHDDRQRLQVTAWWSFFGTVLSLLAAIGGAMLGPYEFVARRVTHVRTGGAELR